MTKIAILSGIQPRQRAVAGAAIAGAWARNVESCKGNPAGSGTPAYSKTCKCASRWHRNFLNSIEEYLSTRLTAQNESEVVIRLEMHQEGDKYIMYFFKYDGALWFSWVHGGGDVAFRFNWLRYNLDIRLNDECQKSKPNSPKFALVYQTLLERLNSKNIASGQYIRNVQNFIWNNYDEMHIYDYRGKEIIEFDRTAYQSLPPTTGGTGTTGGSNEPPSTRPPRLPNDGEGGEGGEGGNGEDDEKKGLTTPQKVAIGVGIFAAVGIAAALYNLNK